MLHCSGFNCFKLQLCRIVEVVEMQQISAKFHLFFNEQNSSFLWIVPPVHFLGVFNIAIIDQEVVLRFLRTPAECKPAIGGSCRFKHSAPGLRTSSAAESKSSKAAVWKQPLTLEHYPLTCDRWRRCRSSQLSRAAGARQHPLSPPWTNIIIFPRPTQTNTVSATCEV